MMLILVLSFNDYVDQEWVVNTYKYKCRTAPDPLSKMCLGLWGGGLV